jgi:hypothetical protein
MAETRSFMIRFDSSGSEKIQYKQSRADLLRIRPASTVRGASLSGGLPRQGERNSGLHSESFRPCPGRRVEKPGRLFVKASTEAAVPVDACSAADRTLSDLPFPSAKGRGVRALTPHRMPVRLFSLPLWRKPSSTGRILRHLRQEISSPDHPLR